MNKIFLVILFVCCIGCVSGYTVDGNHYVFNDSMPSESGDYSDYGVLITGSVTISMGRTSIDGDNIDYFYNISKGVEFKDAVVTFDTSGGTSEHDSDGGNGGSISLVFVSDKIRIINTSFIISSGDGGDGSAYTSSCTSFEGGNGGSVLFNFSSDDVYIDNSSFNFYLGGGGNADTKSCYFDNTGATGGNSGLFKFYIGNNNSYSYVYNTSISVDGGNGGDADTTAYGAGEANCKSGGSPSKYDFYIYGNSVVNNLVYYDDKLSHGGLSDCSADSDSDSTGGVSGLDGVFYLYNSSVINGNITVSGTRASDCLVLASGSSYDAECDGRNGGSSIVSGYFVTFNDSLIYLNSGDGGDADYDNAGGGSCGSGGDIKFITDTLHIYNTSIVTDIGYNGVSVGDSNDIAGGGSGNFYIYNNESVFYKNSMTFSGRTSCDDDDTSTDSHGSNFGIYGGNVSISNSSFSITAGDGSYDNDLDGHIYGGNSVVSGNIVNVYASNISLKGGKSGYSNYGSGFGMINASNVNITKSYIYLYKGNGSDTNKALFITNGSGVSVFDNSIINFSKDYNYGSNNSMILNNSEIRFFNGTRLAYYNYLANFSGYSDYVYINNATVNNTFYIYNRTSNHSIIRYNVSQFGTWSFSGSTINYNTLSWYFSRINSVNISYNNVVPVRTSNFTCDSDYSLFNSSVNVSYTWYINSTVGNTGRNFTGTVLDNYNLTCNVKLNDSTFNLSSNYTISITPGYPYNTVISVDDVIIYSESGFLNSTSKNISLNVSGINRYIQYKCKNLNTCNIPVKFSSSISNSYVNFTSVNFSYGVVNPSSSDVDVVSVVSSDSDGGVDVSNLSYVILPDEETNITVVLNGSSSPSFVYNMKVLYSEFDVSIIPSNVDYWDVMPYSPIQKGVVPYGQNNRVPFFNITTNDSTNEFYLFMRFENGSTPGCVNTIFNNVSTNALGWNVNNSFVNITKLNSSSYVQLWSWSNFSCNYNQIKTFYPNIQWKSLCSGCVNTSDFND